MIRCAIRFWQVFLSLIIPGLGQIYNGRILAGILWLILHAGILDWDGRHARLDLSPRLPRTALTPTPKSTR